MKHTFAVSIGGAAGQGVATPGNIFARIFARRGLHLNAYNAYQSIIRGGHTFLTIRTGPERVNSFGDKIDLLIPLNQDTMDRHLGLLGPGAAVVYNGDTVKPGAPADGYASLRVVCKIAADTVAERPHQAALVKVNSVDSANASRRAMAQPTPTSVAVAAGRDGGVRLLS